MAASHGVTWPGPSSMLPFNHSVGLYPTGLQGLCLPTLKTKDRAQCQQQRHQWFNGWGNLTCMKQGPGITSHRVWPMAGKTWQQALLPEGKGRLPVIGGITSACRVSYHGNQQRGMPLTAPFIRTVTSWGLEQVCRNVSQVSRV